MVGGKKRKIKDFLTYAVLILFACIFTLPTAAMVGTAFKGDTRALSDTGLFPARPELTAFRAVLQSDFLLSALNSLKIGRLLRACALFWLSWPGMPYRGINPACWAASRLGCWFCRCFRLCLC